MRMQHTDTETWYAIADYLSKERAKFTLRDAGTILTALEKVGAKNPIEFDFSEEFTQMEMPLVKLLQDTTKRVDYTAVCQIVTSYSKMQVGSVEFAGILESHIIEYAINDKFKPRELASILYSYSMSEKWSNEVIQICMPKVLEHVQKVKGREIRYLFST